MLNDDAALEERAKRLGERLLTSDWRLVTAESCTGGWIAKVITDLPGSSRWFDRGWVVYSNAAKTAELGVPEAVLDRHGAVSGAVAEALAAGARERAGAQVSLAVSGVAGPDGGTVEKPVGLVWLAWGLPDGRVATRCYHFQGGRETVRRQAVAMALEGTLDCLAGEP